jgi:hypothetical protein
MTYALTHEPCVAVVHAGRGAQHEDLPGRRTRLSKGQLVSDRFLFFSISLAPPH